MPVEQTLVIVKPDGIAKGLVGQILRALQKHNLRVVAQARLQLEREWVESLYDQERDKVYFEEVVEWMSFAPVLLLKIEGEGAVDLVKWKIIGRYPEGIRGQYSEDWIKNVAHAPDSLESALRELRLAESIFKRREQMDESRFRGKMVFALTGMSECGKSTVGKYLDSKGIARIKIVKLFERVRDKWSPDEELYVFVKQQEERDPYALWDAFIDELMAEMDRLNTNAVSIESLYGGGLGPYLKQKLGRHFCIVFLDIPLKIRLVRQMQRENLPDVESAKKHILPRDEIKEKSGIPALKEIADEVVDNSGTLDELYQKMDQIVQRYLQ
jgi:nucleoside-diphosphate kinase